MNPLIGKYDLIQRLQQEALSMQAYKKSSISQSPHTGFEQAFPNKTFPTGAVHEFISYSSHDAAATSGFVSGLLSCLMQKNGTCIWVGTKRTIYPPALKLFGISPEQIIFLDLHKQKDVLWAVEEALKCEAVSTVVGELTELNFTESRRLQLAVEKSHVTGIIHRYNPRKENPVACVTRWKVKPVASVIEDGMPGVGFPRWNVQLLKVRNGKPHTWEIEWSSNGFQIINNPVYSISEHIQRKTG